MKSVFSILFLVLVFYGYAQDSTFVKVFYAGSNVKVPKDMNWKISKAYLTSNDGFNIAISPSNFKSLYISEECVFFPYYISEMELLTDKSSVSYMITIGETKVTK